MSNQKSLQHIFAELPLPFCMANVPDIPITGISIDSRAVKPGHLFVALKGGNVDGHDYIQNAIDNGAVAIVGDKDVEQVDNLPYLRTRKPAPRVDVDSCRVLQLARSQADSYWCHWHGWQNNNDRI